MAQSPANLFPVTDATVQAAYDYIFAPWVKELGLCELSAGKGSASARLPLNAALKFSSGAVCGQAIMAAIDTVVSLAMATTDRAASSGVLVAHATAEFAF